MLLLHRNNGTSSQLIPIYSAVVITNHFTNVLCVNYLCIGVGNGYVVSFLIFNIFLSGNEEDFVIDALCLR